MRSRMAKPVAFICPYRPVSTGKKRPLKVRTQTPSIERRISHGHVFFSGSIAFHVLVAYQLCMCEIKGQQD